MERSGREGAGSSPVARTAAALGPTSIGATAVVRAEDSLAANRGLESAADVTARREGPHLEAREARRKGLTRVEALPLASGAGPVACSQSHVELAYVIAGDGTAYRSMDIGATWTPVAAAPLAKCSY